jgi:hypothetical protein
VTKVRTELIFWPLQQLEETSPGLPEELSLNACVCTQPASLLETHLH